MIEGRKPKIYSSKVHNSDEFVNIYLEMEGLNVEGAVFILRYKEHDLNYYNIITYDNYNYVYRELFKSKFCIENLEPEVTHLRCLYY